MDSYIRRDERLAVGSLAIADGFDNEPVEILHLGQIYANVRDVATGYEWTLMVNRLKAIEALAKIGEGE